jgi:hypothetical protein
MLGPDLGFIAALVVLPLHGAEEVATVDDTGFPLNRLVEVPLFQIPITVGVVMMRIGTE